MDKAKISSYNFENGDCITDGNDSVVLHAAGTAGKAACNFACKKGYWHPQGKAIQFTCTPKYGPTDPVGIDNWGALSECKGV